VKSCFRRPPLLFRTTPLIPLAKNPQAVAVIKNCSTQCGKNELQKQNQHNTRLNTNCNNSALASPSSAPTSNNLFMCFPLEIYKVQQQSRHVFGILRTTVIEISFFSFDFEKEKVTASVLVTWRIIMLFLFLYACDSLELFACSFVRLFVPSHGDAAAKVLTINDT